MDTLTERKKKRISWWKSHRKQQSGGGSTEKSEKPKKESSKKQGSKEEDDVKTKTKDAKAESKRYILFVGNLPFNVTADDVKNHFSCAGGVKGFRLMTKKSGESKGCGFLEFENQPNLWKALKLHHSKLQGRRINVEVTCGGGGTGDERKNKLARKKKKLKARQTAKNKDNDNKAQSQQGTECASNGRGTSCEKVHEDLDTPESVSTDVKEQKKNKEGRKNKKFEKSKRHELK